MLYFKHKNISHYGIIYDFQMFLSFPFNDGIFAKINFQFFSKKIFGTGKCYLRNIFEQTLLFISYERQESDSV